MLIQLALRHEDNINLLRLDRSFILIMKTSGQESLLPALYDVSAQWKDAKELGQTECSLRIALFKCLILEIKSRATLVVEDETKIAQAIKMGWIKKEEGKEPAWTSLVYDKNTKLEIPAPDLGPLLHSDLIQQLDRLLEGMDNHTLQRFHATRPLATEYQGEVVAFLLEISNRGNPCQRMHHALVTLCQSSAMHLVGARLKRETQKRAPLAQKLMEMLQSKYST